MAPPAIGLVPMAKAGTSIAATGPPGWLFLGGALIVGVGYLAYRALSEDDDDKKPALTAPVLNSNEKAGSATSSSASDTSTFAGGKPPTPEKGPAAALNTALDSWEKGGKKSVEFNAERESKTTLPHVATQVSTSAPLSGEGDTRSETSSPSKFFTTVCSAHTALPRPEVVPGDGTGGVNPPNPGSSGESCTPHVPSGTPSDSNPRLESEEEPVVDKQHTISSDSSNTTSQVDQDQDATPAPISHAETNNFSSPIEFTSTADKVPPGGTLRRRARRRGSAASMLSIETYTQGPTAQTENVSSPQSPGSRVHSPNRPPQFESSWAAFHRSG